MGLTATDKGGSDFPLIPEALHTAICYAVFDLGTHHQEKWNKDVHKCLITWELPRERIDIEKDGQTQNLPRVLSKTYTLSLHKKANLRQDLQSWRGRAFTEEELEGFDLKKLLGVPCQLQVIHNTKDRDTYANIATIVKAEHGGRLKTENPQLFFSFEDGERPVIPEGAPEWVQKIIKKSSEWLLSMDPEQQSSPPSTDTDSSQQDPQAKPKPPWNNPTGYEPPEDSSEIPF